MFFYLEWIDKRPSKIFLTEERPKEINYECSFKIQKNEYNLCGNINPKFLTFYPSPKLQYTKNQYLLSHLQKSVRRMDSVKSVKTAKHLIDLDLISFLRRLPIIMLEDVTIHESISVIIWLMIAISKKFVMKVEIVKWLLGVVYYLSNEVIQTSYSKEINEHQWDPQLYSNKINIVLYSLRFRKCYGGMKGDMEMIEYYIGLIINNQLQIADDKIPIIKIEMDPLLREDWIYQANDFHCNRYILNSIQKYYPYLHQDYIKELIWKFSSSINKRGLILQEQKYVDDWNLIKRKVKRIQKNCIYY